MEEARDILDRLEPDLKANKEQLHWDWVYFLSARAKCLVEEDKSEAALKLLEDSFPWIEKELGPDNDGLLLLLPKAIEIARKLKRQEMVTELERMLARLNANRDKYGSGPVDLVNKRLAEGKELVKARRAEEAEKVFLEACTLARYVSWSETTEQVAEFALQQIYASQGELELALKYARRGLAFCERSTRRESGDLAFTEAQVGRLLVALGRKHDGVRYLKRALQSLERMQENESDLYRRLQREMEAAK
jgi:tetratricopeptide (TPR) repeat protein